MRWRWFGDFVQDYCLGSTSFLCFGKGCFARPVGKWGQSMRGSACEVWGQPLSAGMGFKNMKLSAFSVCEGEIGISLACDHST